MGGGGGGMGGVGMGGMMGGMRGAGMAAPHVRRSVPVPVEGVAVPAPLRFGACGGRESLPVRRFSASHGARNICGCPDWGLVEHCP
eukprot:2915294-Prymnesium_polylepis.1